MPSQKYHYVSIGEPSKKLWTDVATLKLEIHNFKDRKESNGQCVESPPVKAHGYEWIISVYPRGDRTSADGYISCFLLLLGQADVTAELKFRWRQTVVLLGGTKFSKGTTTYGTGHFLHRDAVESLLENGCLIIEIDIRIAYENRRVWYPKEIPRNQTWVELYQNASSTTSDVAFSVEGEIFLAHKNILHIRARKLYELSKDCDDDVPIPIDSVRGEIFKKLLDFVYNIKTPEIEKEGIATELLVAADLYDCPHLKLYAESVLVDRFLTAENAAAMLIFADSHSCALLKEEATNWFIAEPETVKQSNTWSKILESNRLLAELLDSLSFAHFNLQHNGRNSKHDIHRYDVPRLRNELETANLEVDGTREVLVNRLKTFYQFSSF